MDSRVKRIFKIFIHINYLYGLGYAISQFFTTSKLTHPVLRRLWAYECWMIFSLYIFFIWLFHFDSKKEQRGDLVVILFLILSFAFHLISLFVIK